jgi:hypothetical protein
MSSKPILGTKTKLGRPKTTGSGGRIGTRWPEPLLRSIDEWREAQEDEPSRAEAIRLLVVLGLSLERVVEKLIENKREGRKAPRRRRPQNGGGSAERGFRIDDSLSRVLGRFSQKQ